MGQSLSRLPTGASPPDSFLDAEYGINVGAFELYQRLQEEYTEAAEGASTVLKQALQRDLAIRQACVKRMREHQIARLEQLHGRQRSTSWSSSR